VTATHKVGLSVALLYVGVVFNTNVYQTTTRQSILKTKQPKC